MFVLSIGVSIIYTRKWYDGLLKAAARYTGGKGP